jgi:predicted secreted hydrolase
MRSLRGVLGALLAIACGLFGRYAPAGAAVDTVAAGNGFADVTATRGIEFPADFGSHPAFRTEWWYVTGWLKTATGKPLGFQVTFFRTRPVVPADNPSAFVPHQLIIAHAALSDPEHGRLWQDQRIERAGFGLAEAATGDTRVWIGRWLLERAGEGYAARVAGEDFSFDLRFLDTQPPLLNGDAGVSRKGPEPLAASYYYSLPHLVVSGSIERRGHADAVTGTAWLDHEWSSQYLDPEAVGWDWTGVNLADGGALMAFRIRDRTGAARWSGGTLRSADGHVEVFKPEDVRFVAGRAWTSPRTGIRYPVAWQVHAGTHDFVLEPLMDDQENDTRLSTGAIYWEGAVRATERGKPVGSGYLELTGYGEKLRLR